MNIIIPEKFMVNITIPEKFMDNYNKVLEHNDNVENRHTIPFVYEAILIFIFDIFMLIKTAKTVNGTLILNFGVILLGFCGVLFCWLITTFWVLWHTTDIDNTYTQLYNMINYLNEMHYYFLNIYAKSSHFSENGDKLYNTYIFVIHGQNKLGGYVKETIYIEDKDSLLDSNKLLNGDFSFLDDVKLMEAK